MNNQTKVLVKKIDYLRQKIEDIIDEGGEKQMEFLLSEIDTYGSHLLKLEVQDQYKEIENEASQNQQCPLSNACGYW